MLPPRSAENSVLPPRAAGRVFGMPFKRKRKLLGAALGSGGAKGLAHLGVMQALEEEGIRFDVLAGTSAGAIAGALYAKGYSPADIAELLARVDYRQTLFSLLMERSAQPLHRLLDGVLGESAFSELQKPFAAVATDTADGGEIVLREGNVARAVFASSAMPPFFRPVQIDGRLLADGAFANAVPGDVARALGADLVIGVALSPANNYREVSFTTASGRQIALRQEGFSRCDILLEPDLSAYTATSVFDTDKIFDIGYACAKQNMAQIVRLLRQNKLLQPDARA